MIKKIFVYLNKLINAILPSNKLGDYVYDLIHFVRVHKRMPKRSSGLLNDYIFFSKNSREAEDPLRVFVSDKFLVKLFVRAVVGEKFNVPTIMYLKSKKAIRQAEFPSRCVIKPSHASGAVILRKAGENYSIDEIVSWCSINYYRDWRERNYKRLQPGVIVEPFIFDKDDVEDFKIFCFNGVPKLIQVDLGRHVSHTRCFFDVDWNPCEFSIVYPLAKTQPKKPRNLIDMINVASKLSMYFPFVRVDLYTNGEQIYVGELTNFPGSGLDYFVPRDSELVASKMVLGDCFG